MNRLLEKLGFTKLSSTKYLYEGSTIENEMTWYRVKKTNQAQQIRCRELSEAIIQVVKEKRTIERENTKIIFVRYYDPKQEKIEYKIVITRTKDISYIDQEAKDLMNLLFTSVDNNSNIKEIVYDKALDLE